MAGAVLARHDTENRRGLERSEDKAKEKACPCYSISLARYRITQNKLIFQ